MKANEPQPTSIRRVLTIGPAESIHDDIVTSLSGKRLAELLPLTELTRASLGEAAIQPADEEFQVESAFVETEAFGRVRDSVEQCEPFALIYIDMDRDNGMDSLNLIEELWKIDSDLHIVTCASYSSDYLEEIVQRLGVSDRLLPLRKPLDLREIRLVAMTLSEKWNVMWQARRQIIGLEEWAVDASRVLRIIQQSHDELESAQSSSRKQIGRLADLVQKRTAEATATRDVAVLALAKLAASRDNETGRHLERMRDYARVLAQYLMREGPYTELIDETFAEDLYRSSPLHDIGKVGISDSILRKPGPLTIEEFNLMKEHTRIGSEAIHQAAQHSEHGGFLRMAAEIAMHHHERFDGNGYPDGLVGHQIPLAARIVALADVFDAITSVRVYKEAASPETAHALIVEQRGLQFDPVVVDAFEACYGQFLDIHSDEYSGMLSGTSEPRLAVADTAPTPA